MCDLGLHMLVVMFARLASLLTLVAYYMDQGIDGWDCALSTKTLKYKDLLRLKGKLLIH